MYAWKDAAGVEDFELAALRRRSGWSLDGSAAVGEEAGVSGERRALWSGVSGGLVFALSYAVAERKRREIKRRHELAVREEW